MWKDVWSNVLGWISLLVGASFSIPIAAHAFEYDEFKMGMNQGDALALAERKGYKFSQGNPPMTTTWFRPALKDKGPTTLSFCGGRLYGLNFNIDGSFQEFVSLVQSNTTNFGNATWTVLNSEPKPGIPTAVFLVKWALPAQHYEFSVLLSYSGIGELLPDGQKFLTDRAVITDMSASYNAPEYICQGK